MPEDIWGFLHQHPWWGLVYLSVLCMTSVFWAVGLGAMAGARQRAGFEARVPGKKDVVH